MIKMTTWKTNKMTSEGSKTLVKKVVNTMVALKGRRWKLKSGYGNNTSYKGV